jgi:hypothetical protein
MEIMLKEFAVHLPDDYGQVQSMPGDPPGSISFMKQTPNSACLAMYTPIPAEQAMPFNSVNQVIDGIRGVLAPDQGIIEVEAGGTVNERKYIYSIIKTVNRGGVQGVQYILTMHIGYYSDYVFQCQAFFDETGLTGARDASVFAILENDHKVGSNGEGWVRDPYDETYAQGALMNLSESREYDATFPNHPLTQARALVQFLIENN